jgi:hypothetical protein
MREPICVQVNDADTAALDATIVRAVLLPAAMKLLWSWNWYLPRRPEWLREVRPRSSVGARRRRRSTRAAASQRRSGVGGGRAHGDAGILHLLELHELAQRLLDRGQALPAQPAPDQLVERARRYRRATATASSPSGTPTVTAPASLGGTP